jgi:Uma2 family endonuclease
MPVEMLLEETSFNLPIDQPRFHVDQSCFQEENLRHKYGLPIDDPEEFGLHDLFHNFQPQLLRETFCPPHYLFEQIFIGKNMNLYYSQKNPCWYKCPDWFAVVGTHHLYPQTDDGNEVRQSYSIWEEQVNPLIVIELLSPSTQQQDLGKDSRKPNQPPRLWDVYEKIVKIPYYVTFHDEKNELQIFKRVKHRYRLQPDDYLWIPELELGLGLWLGTYQGWERQWLRWYDAEGDWVPTPVEQERQRADEQQQIAEKLAAQLRLLGIEPEL